MTGHSEQPDQQPIGGFSTPVGSRRTFFHWVTLAAAGLVGVGLSIPLLSTLISPALQRRRRDWVDVGAADDLPSGHPKQLDHVTTVRDGWLETTSHKAVWAVKQAQGDISMQRLPGGAFFVRHTDVYRQFQSAQVDAVVAFCTHG